MGISIWQILIIAVIVVLLFGRGKISELMGDVAKGIKSFKKGLNEDDEEDEAKADDGGKTIDHKPEEPVAMKKSEDKSKAG
ncbi:twin-arginine translocase TatA/TatE family subunit [Stappia sp. ES.058]|uniref:twin-arginine translocase TatA/TatE family subunit n=1 Tax=Stappia sp. ES.058 TaxID=1881061 RepID=UPI00087C24AB|nr:twin-arginine translocase TatA/TatE family subunit [Stappia sp. ES.058]SDU12472.1 sec-independent protein translocase protein TatA [Stappia sp. ES.058]